jgi:PAS domain S-box-containing protein
VILKDTGVVTAEELRRRAEGRLREKAAQLAVPRTPEEKLRLIHELEVHQIELELQNAELVRARDEADRIAEQYSDLYDFAPVGYFTLDRSGSIKAVNLLGASLLGVERGRLMGRRLGAFVPTSVRPFFLDFLGKAFEQQAKVSCEMPFSREGGEAHFLQVELVPDAAGRECRVAVIDITERRRAEGELALKRRELEDINRFLERSIAQAVEELRQKDEMLILQDRLSVMGEMINNIAHQWNQPLNSLGLVIQQLPLFHGMGELSGEFLEESAEQAMDLIQHMSQTIEVFRSLFKVDKDTTTFSVNQVIARTLSLVEKTLQDQGIEVVFHPGVDPVATGYPNEYSQVLLNILLNARDALVEHQVVSARISIRAVSEGGRSVVTISDNAGGIPEEVLDRIFDAYFTTKGPEKGTGIGLFMSRTIIEKSMKGRLTARNVTGGAEFMIEV